MKRLHGYVFTRPIVSCSPTPELALNLCLWNIIYVVSYVEYGHVNYYLSPRNAYCYIASSNLGTAILGKQDKGSIYGE